MRIVLTYDDISKACQEYLRKSLCLGEDVQGCLEINDDTDEIEFVANINLPDKVPEKKPVWRDQLPLAQIS